MRIRYLESFYGGSHRDVADGIAGHSRHDVALSTLPARYWRWRMRAAGVHFARELREEVRDADLLVCTGLMSLTDLAALLGPRRPPILLYAHETQIVYPDRDAGMHVAFTDLANMLVANHIAFNSHTHRGAYLAELPGFLERMPEYQPSWAIDEIARKSSVCYPGIEVAAPDDRAPGADSPSCAPCVRSRDDEGLPPLVLWNHRWEYDKDPDAFFAALRVARERGYAFRLALLGESPGREPSVFAAARTEFASQLVHYGYLESRDAYRAWLDAADIIVSTAIQENFGISVVEAIAHGALPLLPNRLSYPEIIPSEHHSCLYEDSDLPDRLCEVLQRPRPQRRAPDDLVAHARSFAWQQRIGEFDALFERTAGAARG